ncbi:MAG: Asp-tRNA(Asn)/Glu-tRNA(Gln) amidotransferase subunit GatA [Clostridiales bacterium]|nr:Asp-tRNA(Asn)/Glu-tRNA(Gln) amidotransferase subunit GatA [Clostridiales bacterium]
MDADMETVCGIAGGVKEKKFKAAEIIEIYLKNITKQETKINAFISTRAVKALDEAKMIDEKIAKGERVGRLAGVPVGVKDNICTEGIKTTCASKMLENYISPYDATVIEKLKKEGAIIIGKTNMDEFAMGSSTENSAFKTTSNPWNLSRVPGGSSGGSAAAVASDFVPLSLGSDTGGSIRQPAAFCGIVGLKPTYGSISRFGLVAFASSLDQIGPMTKNVKDCVLSLEVLQGNDSRDATSSKRKFTAKYLLDSHDANKMKVAIPKQFFGDELDAEVKNSIMGSVERLQDMGVKVDEVSMPIDEEILSAYYIISSAEASSNLARFDGIRYGYRTSEYNNVEELMINSRTEAFGEEVKRRILLGTYVLSAGYYDAFYNKAHKMREAIKRRYHDIFSKYDLILSPVTPTVAFEKGEKIHSPMQMYLQDLYTVSVNLAGLPALSMNCGFDKNNLPIGLQIIGSHYSEEKMFQLAYLLESKLDLKKKVIL